MKHKRGTPEWRAQVRRGTLSGIRRRAARLEALPSDLRELELSGTVRRELLPFIQQAGEEAALIAAALGPGLSPQRRSLLGSLVRISALESLTAVRALQSPEDGDAAARVGTLIGHRRRLLETLGLEWHREEKSLAQYLAQRAAAQEPQRAPIDVRPVCEPEPDAESAAAAGDESGGEP